MGSKCSKYSSCIASTNNSGVCKGTNQSMDCYVARTINPIDQEGRIDNVLELNRVFSDRIERYRNVPTIVRFHEMLTASKNLETAMKYLTSIETK